VGDHTLSLNDPEFTMIRIGQKIDDFALEVHRGDEIKKVRFSAYKGKWLVLLFSSLDCAELDKASAYYNRFTQGGAEILAVSMNPASEHKARQGDSLPMKRIVFPIAADPSARLCRYFGTYRRSVGGTFIIDPDGVLRARTIKTEASAGGATIPLVNYKCGAIRNKQRA
jgi:peroxiredoxin (alkyl hydroperoxide reductase subunit C)